MNIEKISHWKLFLHSFDKNKSIATVKRFLAENKRIKLVGEIRYSHYWKLESIQADFTCSHIGTTWEDIVSDVILTAQRAATGLVLTGSIDETVDVFSNSVRGAKGAIRALSITCDREKTTEP